MHIDNSSFYSRIENDTSPQNEKIEEQRGEQLVKIAHVYFSSQQETLLSRNNHPVASTLENNFCDQHRVTLFLGHGDSADKFLKGARDPKRNEGGPAPKNENSSNNHQVRIDKENNKTNDHPSKQPPPQSNNNEKDIKKVETVPNDKSHTEQVLENADKLLKKMEAMRDENKKNENPPQNKQDNHNNETSAFKPHFEPKQPVSPPSLIPINQPPNHELERFKELVAKLQKEDKIDRIPKAKEHLNHTLNASAPEKHEAIQKVASDFFVDQGKSLNQSNAPKAAAVALEEAIKCDPNNKEAHIEKAHAHYQLQEDEKTLEHFSKTDIAKYFAAQQATPPSFKEGLGFAIGATKGAVSGVVHFLPNTFDTVASVILAPIRFATHPFNTITTVANNVGTAIDYVRMHTPEEMFSHMLPSIKELEKQWNSLSDYEKGEKTGQMITEAVVECYLFSKVAKGVKQVANLTRTNSEIISTMERSLARKNKIKQLIKEENQQYKKFIQPHKSKNLPESQIRKILHEAGYKTFPRPKGVPENYLVKITDKGAGMEYVHPTNTHISVRMMPGKSHSQNLNQQKPYVIQKKDGKAFDKHGNLVGQNAPEAHIPLEEFIYRE